MSGAQTTLTLQDKLTGPLMKMMKAMDSTIKVMEKMESTSTNMDTKGLANAKKSIQSASSDLERLRSTASAAGQKGVKPLQEDFAKLPGHVDRASSSVRNFATSIAGAALAYVSIQGVVNGFKNFVGESDTFVSTSARLGLINDGLQTQAELQDKIYNAAQRSRSAYVDMASGVAKLNLLAGDAFSGNDEAIRFSELMGKAFTISGAGTSERQAGMHQLTQAMASGRLQGDEFRSITENAPLLAHAIADSMGVSIGALKEMSSEGTITADIIKNALFQASDEIENKFKDMPLTFGQSMTAMKNWGMTAFEPLLVRFNNFVNSETFSDLSNQVMIFITLSVAGLTILFDILGSIYTAFNAVAEFWPIIAAGLAVLLTLYFPLIMTHLNVMLIKLWLMLEPIMAQAAAWAIAYWPITLVILAVMALIGILMYFGVTTEQILGFVGGLFYTFGAVIWNTVAHIWNYVAMFAEFLINVFIDPTYAVKKLFYDWVKSGIDLMGSLAGSFDKAADVLGQTFVTGANIAITAINWIVDALNNIPGVNLSGVSKLSASTGSNFSAGMKSLADNLQAPTSSKGVVSIPRMELKSLPGAFKSGQSAGSNMKLPSFGPSKDDGTELVPQTNLLSELNPTGGKLDSIGKIDDEISIADEDLKLLKELADIRSIQNFKSLNPSITFTGDMTVREEADIDKIVTKLNDSLKGEMDDSTDGVYA